MVRWTSADSGPAIISYTVPAYGSCIRFRTIRFIEPSVWSASTFVPVYHANGVGYHTSDLWYLGRELCTWAYHGAIAITCGPQQQVPCHILLYRHLPIPVLRPGGVQRVSYLELRYHTPVPVPRPGGLVPPYHTVPGLTFL